MKIRILDIIPIVYTDYLKEALNERKKLALEFKEKTNNLVEIEFETLPKGTASIESLHS